MILLLFTYAFTVARSLNSRLNPLDFKSLNVSSRTNAKSA
ncbi:hypothetical protein CLOSBL3_11093 [Clostridiaceae bacterium BL-3]|nr:hypothetical protein CLOSBL3_11093 [Clostridiaceae bacterium BL-3]